MCKLHTALLILRNGHNSQAHGSRVADDRGVARFTKRLFASVHVDPKQSIHRWTDKRFCERCRKCEVLRGVWRWYNQASMDSLCTMLRGWLGWYTRCRLCGASGACRSVRASPAVDGCRWCVQCRGWTALQRTRIDDSIHDSKCEINIFQM